MQTVKDLPSVQAFIVTGLSGAGISTALQVFEDLGFFTIDGLPVSLMYEMVTMMRHDSMRHFQGIALGLALQDRHPVDDMSTVLQMLHLHSVDTHILYFEASEGELLRRYATTRRPHPLERKGLGLEHALVAERNELIALRNMADFVFDTTHDSIHDLRRKLQQQFGNFTTGDSASILRPLKVNIISFGFKYGVPKEADMVLDVRFLPNPHFEAHLRPLSGLDATIDAYVFGQKLEQVFSSKLLDFIVFTLGLMEAEWRYLVTLDIACTGGRHRSVATTQRVSKMLNQAGYAVSVEHRHMSLDIKK